MLFACVGAALGDHGTHDHGTHDHETHDHETHAHKHGLIEPPLPTAHGRGILGCFLQDERHCVGSHSHVDHELPRALHASEFSRVPLRSVACSGWLSRQLLLQANGMSGWYQALFYPPVNQSMWVGGSLHYGLHYMVTYWLNGNVPLASLLGTSGQRSTHDLSPLAAGYLEHIMSAQDKATGRLGPDACGGQFSKMNAIRSLLLAAEGTLGSAQQQLTRSRIGSSVLRGLREMYECTLAGKTSGGIRWPSYIEAIEDFIDAFQPAQADIVWLMNMSLTWRASGADWQTYYADPTFPGCPFPTAAVAHPTHSGCEGCYYHGVNTAEALKLGAVQFRLWGKAEDATMLLRHLSMLDASHGHPQGTFGMDEFLAGRDPQRGSELCDIVEIMYSLEWSFQQVGRALQFVLPPPQVGEVLNTLDRVETLAFNALPGTTTPDLWQHQYDHQTNGIAAGPGVYCGGSNGADATIYGLQPHYPCCTVNLPQGWPKLAASAVLSEKRADGGDGLLIAHLLPVNISADGMPAGAKSLSIATEYPFGDSALITIVPSSQLSGAAAAHGDGGTLHMGLRVPGWADKATISIDGGPPQHLVNGTIYRWAVVSSAGVAKPATALVQLNPSLRVELGWGSHRTPAPAAVNYSSTAPNATVPSNAASSWLLSDGPSIVGSRNASAHTSKDLRSGGPGSKGTATLAAPLNSFGHLISAITFTFSYISGYEPPAGKNATGSRLSLALVDALNGTRAGPILWTSPPLDKYSFDHFTGYSPLARVRLGGGAAGGLGIGWPRSLRVAMLFDDNDRNLQIPLSSISLTVEFSDNVQPFPWAASDLSTAATNAAAVRRGPLLFALPLQAERSTLHIPASGGECESTQGAPNCKSSDIAFHSGPGAAFNYALLLPSSNPESVLALHRTSAGAPDVPFDPRAPPLTISVPARRVASWKTMRGGLVTEPPPPSPMQCGNTSVATTGSDGHAHECSGQTTTLQLVPFGSTPLRIAAFPWIRD